MTAIKSLKWRSVLGLVLIYLAIWFDWPWIWGVLFLMWVIPDLFSGVTYFLEPVFKKEDPVLYWAIVISWLWMSFYFISLLFFPEWG